MRDTVRFTLLVAAFLAALTFLSARPAADANGAAPVVPAEAAAGEAVAEKAPDGARTGTDDPPDAVRTGTDEARDSGTAPQAGFDAGFRLPVLRGETVESLDLHDYLTGVLLAEMPVSFADEALKAQAVASRTYALRSYTHRRHENAAVCLCSGCCQGWRDPAQAEPAARERAEAAVTATDGLVLRYGGALIDATFFACSGGQTEDAAAVWGSELPYLKSVASPGEEGAAHFTDETRVPLEAFRAALEAEDSAVRFPEALGGWVGDVRFTAGGGVDEIELGGRPFRGTWLRKRFGLRSTAFTLELTQTEAVFVTRGWGHRVGMSQYGADAMARAGSGFAEILTWYYQGVELGPAEP